MSTGPTGAPVMLADLIRERDRDALSGFYDGRAAYVAAYCAAVCAPDHVDDAIQAAFTDFLARIAGAPPDADLELLLVKSTRSSAAARVELPANPAECRATPELLAASANGELVYGDEALAGHLERCATCQAAAERLLDAERQLKEPPRSDAPVGVRGAWLGIVALPPDRR